LPWPTGRNPARIDIRDFLVKLPLGEPDLPDLFELPLEELICEGPAALETFGIHGPALDGVVLDDLVRPLAELDRALVLNLETHRNDRLQAVMLRLVVLAVGGSY
jgi:hypothetical protein